MVKTGKVNGDAVDLAMRVVFAGDDARWQGAMAELQTVMRFASKGNRVRILSPDVYMRDQTPDIMVETENGPVLVEVKSRKYFSATSSFEEVIQPALVNAAEQINAKARRHYGTVKGIISIHLLGSSEEDLVMEKIYDLVNRSRFSKEFGNIAGIEVNFISSSGSSKRGWPVKSFRLLSEYKPKKGGGGGSGNGGPAPVASSSGTSSGETAFAPIAGYEGDQAAAELSPAARAQLLQGSGAPTLMTGAAVYTGAPSATTAPAYIQLPIVP